MKAKEYVEQYNKKCAPDFEKKKCVDAIVDICVSLIDEMYKLNEKRGVKTDAGFIGCYREIKQKWMAIYPHIKGSHDWTFDAGIKAMLPKLYEIMKTKTEMYVP